ncbi:MAG: class I SAM-dependent rRNA methyltransferase [Endomicrobia bacterium]|nr:class I SAM-dependent rRNA methyltransferase [Endomicrobiia bacterium]
MKFVLNLLKEMKIIKIKTNKNFRNNIKYGFLWIFLDEINRNDTPNEISLVEVYDNRDKFICKGVFNPNSFICIRVLTVNRDEKIDENYFIGKMKNALRYREKLGLDLRYCRILYGESDLLPGVVIDRYNDIFVTQFYSYAMELFKNEIISALKNIFNASYIIIKNDFYQRSLEKAPQNKEIIPLQNYKTKNEFFVNIEHLGCKFIVDIYNGQKTGFYYDQLLNRKYISNIVKDKIVLDLCCYVGGFSIVAAKAGAKKVIGIDTSAEAIRLAQENIKINNLKNIEFIETKSETYLRNNTDKYDIIIYDPPSFAKSKKDVSDAITKYKYIIKQIILNLKMEGVFNFSICSRHINEFDMRTIMVDVLSKYKQQGYVIYNGEQSLDHPVYLNMHEQTKYLKFISFYCGS